MKADSLEVVLSATCNLNCTYCYQNAKRPLHMDWDTARAAADLLLCSARPEVDLTFYGGEPLLEFRLIRRLIDYVAQRRPAGMTVRYALITNGTRLGADAMAFLAAHKVRTQLSHDGVPAAQHLRAPDTFARLDSLLDRLRAEQSLFFRHRLFVSMTATADNLPYLAESLKYFLEKGLREIHIAPRTTFEPGWRPQMLETLDRQFDRMYRSCLRHFLITGDVPLSLFARERDEVVDSPVPGPICRIGIPERLTVDVDGQVYGCVMLAESFQSFPTESLRRRLPPLRIGHLRDPRFPERLAAYADAAAREPMFRDKTEKYSSYSSCSACPVFQHCQICPVSICHVPGNTDPNRIPEFPCAFYRIALGYREKFPPQRSSSDTLHGPRQPDWPA